MNHTWVKVMWLVGSILAVLLAVYFASSLLFTRNCGDFSSQAKAQKAFEANFDKYRRLDGDRDGFACEHLK